MLGKIAYVINEKHNSSLIKTQVLKLIEELNNQGLNFVLFGRDLVNSTYKFEKYQSIFDLFIKLYRIRNDLSVVHFRGYYPFMFIGIFLRFFNIKVIWDPRGVQPEEYLYQKRCIKGYIGYLYFKFGEILCLYSSNAIVSVSNNMATYYSKKKYFRSNCLSYVIPSLPSQDSTNTFSKIVRSDLGLLKDDVVFCFSGSLSKWQLFEETCGVLCNVFSVIKSGKFLVLTNDFEEAKITLSKYFHINQYLVLSVDSNKVIDYLQLGDYGILFRENILINRVSSPIKLNDYVVSGIYSFASSIIGDVEQVFNKYNLGTCICDLKDAHFSIIEIIKEKKKINLDDRVLYIEEYIGIHNIAIKYKHIYESI